MRLRKKTVMLLSIALGSLMFATTAMAEVAAKSGYEQAKDSLKYTAEGFSSKLSSYTVDMSFVMKDNDKVISSESTLGRYDVTKNAHDSISTSINGDKKTESYFYRDKKTLINYNNNEDIYYVSEYDSPSDYKLFENPFKQKEAGDIERIVDAFVGNLKDYVIVKDNSDGSKELSGSLSEAQIPALVNAVVSYQLKREFGYNRNQYNESNRPVITEDVFVKEIKGKMNVDKDGLIQSVLGTGIINGKDKNGNEHNLTFEILGKISDVNSSVVNKPDLSGKKTEKSIQKNYDKLTNPELYIGSYKNDIIIEKSGKFEKIGERIVNIESMSNNSVSGRYYEQYKKGYEDYSKNVRDFKFKGDFENNPYHINFEYVDATGKTINGDLSFNPNSANIYFGSSELYNNKNGMYEGDFKRVFE